MEGDGAATLRLLGVFTYPEQVVEGDTNEVCHGLVECAVFAWAMLDTIKQVFGEAHWDSQLGDCFGVLIEKFRESLRRRVTKS